MARHRPLGGPFDSSDILAKSGKVAGSNECPKLTRYPGRESVQPGGIIMIMLSTAEYIAAMAILCAAFELGKQIGHALGSMMF